MRRSDINTEGRTGAKALQLPQISPDTICNVQWLETSGVWILHRHRHCVMIWKKNCIYWNNSHVKVMECEDRDSGNWVCDTTNCRQMSCESTTYSMCWASLLGPLSKVLHVQLWCQHPWQRIYFEAAKRQLFLLILFPKSLIVTSLSKWTLMDPIGSYVGLILSSPSYGMEQPTYCIDIGVDRMRNCDLLVWH